MASKLAILISLLALLAPGDRRRVAIQTITPRVEAPFAEVPPTAARRWMCGCCGGSPTRVIFVCDTSASVAGKMPRMHYELDKAISGLRATQSFDIFLMRHGRPILSDLALVRATPRRKLRAKAIFDKTIGIGPPPTLDAIAMAVHWRPNYVFLLVDPSFPGSEALALLRQVNSQHKVRINVVAFADSTDDGAAWFDGMKKLVQENGGTAKRVDVDKPPQ